MILYNMLINLLIGFLVVSIIVGISLAVWKAGTKKTPTTTGKFDPATKIGPDSGCPEGKAMYKGKCTVCLMSSLTQYNGKCICPKNKRIDSGQCVECGGENYYINDNDECVKCVGNGMVIINGECTNCFASNQVPNNTNTLCEYCPAGYIFNNISKNCDPCPAGSRYTGSGTTAKCESCIDQGKIVSPDSKTCQYCDIGEIMDINGKCVPCPLGDMYTGSGANAKCEPVSDPVYMYTGSTNPSNSLVRGGPVQATNPSNGLEWMAQATNKLKVLSSGWPKPLTN
jgi:hypothetical protein